MTLLLHISSSPRGEASESLGISRVFLDGYRETHPGARVETFDLWDGSLPEFFEDWLRWAGVTDISAIRFQPNLASADVDTARRLAQAQACDVGKAF